MKTIDLEQGSQAWLDWRRNGITATEAAVILGADKNTTPLMLYRQKKGLLEVPDLSVIPAVRFGKANEPVIRERWQDAHFDIATPCCGEWDVNPVFRASFDGINADGRPVEFKCPTPDGTTLKDVRANGVESEAYRKYYVQVQHQLLVSDADKGFLVFMDGDSFIEFEILRDENMIAEIIDKGQAFWRCMERNTEPESSEDADVYFPREQGEVDEWLQAAELYLNAQDEIKRIEESVNDQKAQWMRVKAEAENSLKRLVGSHRKADFGGITVCRSVIHGKVDEKLLAKKGVSADLIEECRKADTERWLFKGAKSLTPKGLKDEAAEKAIENRSVPESPTWF
jgi:putative phage-type endonuclease